MKHGKHSVLFTLFVKLTGLLPTLLFLKPKVYLASEKASRILRKPCILMSNHISLMDFPLYEIVFYLKNPRFLVAEVLYNKSPVLHWLLDHIGAIYVNRDTFDFSFIENAVRELDHGRIVGIFPEGRIRVKGEVHPFRPSVALLALQTDAPIIPCYTDGNYGLFKSAHVMIGEPIYLRERCASPNPSAAELQALTDELRTISDGLGALLEERVHGKK